MQYRHGVCLIAVSGCATSLSVGAQGVIAPRGGASVEATAAGGVGLGTSEDAFVTKVEAALGAARSGEAQGRVGLGSEYISFGRRVGWQLRGCVGGSFGAYQSRDLTAALAGGLHWNIARQDDDRGIFVTSLALDLTAGYAFAKPDEIPAGDGAFVGVGLSFRRDTVDGPSWHPH